MSQLLELAAKALVEESKALAASVCLDAEKALTDTDRKSTVAELSCRPEQDLTGKPRRIDAAAHVQCQG